MSSMFLKCYALTTIVGLDKLDTSKVTKMGSMFGYCQNIESLDVSKFDTSNVTDMSKMFMTCQKLTSLDFKVVCTHLNVTNNRLYICKIVIV
nr:DUF285 [uncultured Ruminococcus sp.]